MPPPDRFQYLNHPNSSNNNSNPNSQGNKCFKCNYCESDFAQQNSLNQHIQMVHKINPPPSSSDYRYSSQIVHQAHPQHLSCQYCRNTFTNRSQLERHLRIHLSSIDLKCNICDRSFETQDLLSQHKLTHCKTYDVDSSNSVTPASQVCVTN